GGRSGRLCADHLGRTGVWLRLWVDSNDPDTSQVHLLLRHGLQQIAGASVRGPVYIAVRDYQGGLSSILEEYGFAPFTDRVRMVRPIWQWAKKAVENRLPSLEGVAEAMPGSLVMPQATNERRRAIELLTPWVRTIRDSIEKSDVTT
ncbi:MAG: hypothetical protein HY328_01170, partial [Chloroflexi bacterium]|nr:hypothetical protein [Chloroflexota bacterium]